MCYFGCHAVKLPVAAFLSFILLYFSLTGNSSDLSTRTCVHIAGFSPLFYDRNCFLTSVLPERIYRCRRYCGKIELKKQQSNNTDSSKFIRNFCIVAHVDHGKSTLADRLLELTNTVSQQNMRNQYLDDMDIERERGITIKLRTVRMQYPFENGDDEALPAGNYILNLIDTPGHVDFSFEVKRTMEVCEGAVLLVDASKGIQAQTVANLRLAMSRKLKIIPVINKIDLPGFDISKLSKKIAKHLNVKEDEILKISAKTGEGIDSLLREIVERIPPPEESSSSVSSKSIIFDSYYDAYKGVVVFVKIVAGRFCKNQKATLSSNLRAFEISEVGMLFPDPRPIGNDCLRAGEVGWLSTGIRNAEVVSVGDSICSLDKADERDKIVSKGRNNSQETPKDLTHTAFCSFYPTDSENSKELQEALRKLKLSDAAILYEAESSHFFGSGFRCGFLGILHMEVVKERLLREFKLDLYASSSSVEFRYVSKEGKTLSVTDPSKWPRENDVAHTLEPYVKIRISLPNQFLGAVFELVKRKFRGFLIVESSNDYEEEEEEADDGEKAEEDETEAENAEKKKKNAGKVEEEDDEESVLSAGGPHSSLSFNVPLTAVVSGNFVDNVKAHSKGFAVIELGEVSFYESKLGKLEIKVNGELLTPLTSIVHADAAYSTGSSITTALSKLIPRQQIKIAIQAVFRNRIIAASSITAVRKDVTAKLYGGDHTRRQKLLDNQKKNKKKMRMIGKVQVPQEVFFKMLKNDENR